jgi:hypothetical protein
MDNKATFEVLPLDKDGKPTIDLQQGGIFIFSRELQPTELKIRTPAVNGVIRG